MAASPPQPIVGTGLFPAPLPEVSVYVHVPFCSSRCNYCDFYFETTRSPRIIRETLARIVEEAAFFYESMGGPRIRSLYFGGGTPSVIPPDLLDAFLSRLQSVLFPAAHGGEAGAGRSDPSGPVEWSFEANPETVTGELLAVLRGHGCNRVSLGVQSFQDSLLVALTRRADRQTVFTALESLAAAKSGGDLPRINIDLMTGIPGQTAKMVYEDIETALRFGADHFSVYSLTVEEHTPLKQAVERGVRRMPPQDAQDSLWLAAREELTGRGFDWYEISNFARRGCRSAHNLGYWRSEPYLGLGPGAVSTIPMRFGGRSERLNAAPAPLPVRLTNPNLFLYASRLDRQWRHEVERIEPAALLFEQFLTGLRTSEGVPFSRPQAVFGLDLRERWRQHLARWAADGIVKADSLERQDPVLVLAPPARLALDRHLLALRGWIDELGEIPPPAWPAPMSRAGIPS